MEVLSQYRQELSLLDSERVVLGLQGLETLLSMITFSVMAASTTSHHGYYHYSYFPSLMFVVCVGVLGFLLGLCLLAARALPLIAEHQRSSFEVSATGAMAFLAYTAAVSASTTSTDWHTAFDEDAGSFCQPRHHRARAGHAAHFCGHVVAATVFTYFLAIAYVLTFFLLRHPNGYARAPSSGYDEIETTTTTTNHHHHHPESGDDTTAFSNKEAAIPV